MKNAIVKTLLFLLLTLIIGVFLALGPLGCSLGPPKVNSHEAYEQQGTATFEHGTWAKVLAKFVNEKGLVNYKQLKEEPDDLDLYLAQLAKAPFDELGRNDKLALLLNAYNAFTLRLILDHYPIKSIEDIPRQERWLGRTFVIATREFTLHEIEHQECRAKFIEPRVHFALNCASFSCPPLRGEPFVGARLEQQLSDQAKTFMAGSQWNRINHDERELQLSKIFDWYDDDFTSKGISLADYVAGISPGIPDVSNYTVTFRDYDWGLNESR